MTRLFILFLGLGLVLSGCKEDPDDLIENPPSEFSNNPTYTWIENGIPNQVCIEDEYPYKILIGDLFSNSTQNGVEYLQVEAGSNAHLDTSLPKCELVAILGIRFPPKVKGNVGVTNITNWYNQDSIPLASITLSVGDDYLDSAKNPKGTASVNYDAKPNSTSQIEIKRSIGHHQNTPFETWFTLFVDSIVLINDDVPSDSIVIENIEINHSYYHPWTEYL